MRITIIGKGKVGSALGRGWTGGGYQVRYGVRQPQAADEATVADACSDAEVVVLATPWAAVPDAIAAAGGLADRIVIDATNAIAFKNGRLASAVAGDTSGAEEIAAMAPGAAVFKTLNQTGEENLGHAAEYQPAPVMFVAGDDSEKKVIVIRLVADLGFDAVDGGPLSNARLLEALAMLWIDQALVRGHGRQFAFARVGRSAE